MPVMLVLILGRALWGIFFFFFCQWILTTASIRLYFPYLFWPREGWEKITIPLSMWAGWGLGGSGAQGREPGCRGFTVSLSFLQGQTPRWTLRARTSTPCLESSIWPATVLGKRQLQFLSNPATGCAAKDEQIRSVVPFLRRQRWTEHPCRDP